MTTAIQAYFERVSSYSKPRFIIELTLMCFLLKFISVFLATIVFSWFGINSQTDTAFEQSLVSGGLVNAFFLIIIFASFETITGQWLMLWVSSKFTKSNLKRIVASAVIFSALHIEPILIAAVFPIGLVLAWVFLTKRKTSTWEAFWVTTAIHVLHNLIVLSLVFLFPA
jgi:membrane protease YdiL (CAAX protease family)